MKAKIFTVMMLVAAMLACGVNDASARKTKKKTRTYYVNTNGSVGSDDRDSGKRARKSFGGDADLAQIVNHTPYDIIYTTGDRCEVVIEGPQRALSRLNAGISNRTLTFRPAHNEPIYGDVTIHVTAPDVGTFNIYGSGDLIAERIEAISVKIQNFGSGDFIADKADCTSLAINCYGSGDITVKKAICTSGRILSQGSGDINIHSILSSMVEVILQGSSDVKINGIDSTSVQALSQGSGDITLSGNTTTAYLTSQGSGDISASRLKAVRTSKVEQGTGEIND